MDEKFNRIPVSVINLDKDGTVIDVEDYNLDKVEPACWCWMRPTAYGWNPSPL